MFAPDGKPLRAKLTVDLKEYKPLTLHLAELGFMSADHTKATVVRETTRSPPSRTGSTATTGAGGGIADENGIADPLALRAGQILRMPTGAGR